MNIATDYWLKPIPDRRFDWSAVDDDTYDGEGCAIGYGATEEEARADLIEQLAEQDDRCPRCGEDVRKWFDGIPDGCRDPRCPGTAT